MSDQLWASCNLDLWTSGVCSTNLNDSLSPVIKKTPCMAATTAQSVLIHTYYTHYFKTQNSYLGAYSLQRTGQQAHPHLGISEQTKPRAGRTQISINNQLSLAHRDSSRSPSIWICLADVRHPPSAYSRLEIITQLIDSLGNGCAFVQPNVICDTEFHTNLKIMDIICKIGVLSIITIVRISSIICNYRV